MDYIISIRTNHQKNAILLGREKEMNQTNLSPQSKEIVSRLYSSDEYNKREAIYRILFDRRTDLLGELKKAVNYEKNEQIAVFMVQVCLTLTNFPRDGAMEKRILDILQYDGGGGVNGLAPTMWKYLESCATSQMIIAILGAMRDSIPAMGYDFIEMCLTNPDPDVRAIACEKAIKSGRPTHFAYVLNLIADKDPIVSQAAFMAIKNLPEQELAIILDYSLGSPDEWVLKTVAPFLPNIITNNLRSVISKVQYHSNHLVAQKAREALKILDSVPYAAKRPAKRHEEEEEEKRKKEEEKQKADTAEKENKISLREQLEFRRKAQEEEERKEREANEILEQDLVNMGKGELEEFSKLIDSYDSVIPDDEEGLNKGGRRKEEEELAIEKDRYFIENMDFAKEAEALAQTAVGEEEIKEELNKAEEKEDSSYATVEEFDANSLEMPIEVNRQEEFYYNQAEVFDLDGIKIPTKANYQKKGIEKGGKKGEKGIEGTEGVRREKEGLKKSEEEVEEETKETAAETPQKAEKVIATKVQVPISSKEIFEKYPSFLTEPLLEVFKPSDNQTKVKDIERVLDNLTAFLNLCFLQSVMYYAQGSDMLTKSIKDCIKGNLTGPSAIRCLHNFILAMKAVRGNPVFFTFSLSKSMGDSSNSDTNPLMLMRELKDFLREPEEVSDEIIHQAIDGLLEILRGVRGITANMIIMRSPLGAKQPYADLSGPVAKVLETDKRPSIELPRGEIVLISQDGTEAFGLFPFFKYTKKKIIFEIPNQEELKTLYERLEINP